MKNTNKFLMFIAGLLITLYSCDKEVEKQILPDAYIISKIVGVDTIYSLGAYVSSNTAMKSVSIKSPDGSLNVDLIKTDEGGQIFERQLKDENFSKIKPTVGNYNFEITYDDETAIDTTDYVSSETLDPIAVENVEFNSEYNSIEVSWVKNEEADFYILIFLRHDSIVFKSNSIGPNFSSVDIYNNTPNWYHTINSNPSDTLQVLVTSVLYESSNSINYEFQSLAHSKNFDYIFSK